MVKVKMITVRDHQACLEDVSGQVVFRASSFLELEEVQRRAKLSLTGYMYMV